MPSAENNHADDQLPLFTIKPIGPRFQLRGPDLPNGMWFDTAKAAVQQVRETLAQPTGCRVEVYAPEDVPYRTFVFPAQPPAASRVCSSSLGILTAEDMHRRAR